MNRLQAQPRNVNAFIGLSNAFTDFYEHMDTALRPNGRLVEAGKTAGSARIRPATHQAE